MTEKKLYLLALSKIPKRFIDDATNIAVYTYNQKVILANPKFAPMFYTLKSGRWLKLKLDPGDTLKCTN